MKKKRLDICVFLICPKQYKISISFPIYLFNLCMLSLTHFEILAVFLEQKLCKTLKQNLNNLQK